MRSIHVAGKIIGEDAEPFIIAEAGVNHNGSVEIAKSLAETAAKAGADAIKFQTYKTEDLVQKTAPLAQYQQENLAGTKDSQFAMLKRYEFSFSEFRQVKQYCDERGILFLTTPHTGGAVLDFVDSLVPLFKIGSGDLTNHPFLREVARRGKPVIVGTGMGTLPEVRAVRDLFMEEGNDQLVFLHCTTNYPCDFHDVNLRAMETIRERTGCLVGYSDHTRGLDVAIIAVARGATVVEKHFTLDRSMEGPDHRASVTPTELEALVTRTRRVPVILGSAEKKPTAAELANIPVVRKSLCFAQDVAPGTILQREHVRIMRPGTGIPPSKLETILGREVRRAAANGTLISQDDLGDEEKTPEGD